MFSKAFNPRPPPPRPYEKRCTFFHMNKNISFLNKSISENPSYIFLRTKPYISLADKVPPPLTDMSAKNVSIFGRLPLTRSFKPTD